MRGRPPFPIVPGLGNLLLHLGFNQSAFLVPAFLDSLGPHLWAYSLLGGIFPWLGLTLSVFALVQGLCALFLLRRRLEPIEKAYAISLPAWMYTLLINNISGNSPDIALACLQIHIFLCFASFLAARGSQAVRLQLSELIILSALSVCVKLNSVFFSRRDRIAFDRSCLELASVRLAFSAASKRFMRLWPRWFFACHGQRAESLFRDIPYFRRQPCRAGRMAGPEG